MRTIRWLLLFLAAPPLALVALSVATIRNGDAALYPPCDGTEAFPVYLADHGYPAGIILRRDDLDKVSPVPSITSLGLLAELR